VSTSGLANNLPDTKILTSFALTNAYVVNKEIAPSPIPVTHQITTVELSDPRQKTSAVQTYPKTRNYNVAETSSAVIKSSALVRPLNRDLIEPLEGVYFVIGSFRNYSNARKLASYQGSLSPVIISAKLNGTSVYRVVIGPARKGGLKALYTRAAKAGLSDTWAIRVAPGEWAFAELTTEPKKHAAGGMELAASYR
jgi:hypothetical protein